MAVKNPHWTAKKYLGQHFLISEKVKQAIIATCPPSTDAILEIGPGAGALTDLLPALQKPLLTIEIDQRFIPHLQTLMPAPNIVAANALAVDYATLLKPYKAVWVVSNMPYNIAAPLMRQLLPHTSLAGMTLMMQKEMANKVLLLPPKQGMNSLGLLLQSFWEINQVCVVDPAAFRPRPKVNSAVLFFSPRQHPWLPLPQLLAWEKFLRQLFAHRRKQIQSVLTGMSKTAWPAVDSAAIAAELLQKALITPTYRAEALRPSQILRLFQSWQTL